MDHTSPSGKKTPWDFIGEDEKRILGDVITSPEEQARWCKAMVFGTLPYMWREDAARGKSCMDMTLSISRSDANRNGLPTSVADDAGTGPRLP